MAAQMMPWRRTHVHRREQARRKTIHLVLLALLLALALGRLGADLLVVLLEGGEVLAGLSRGVGSF